MEKILYTVNIKAALIMILTTIHGKGACKVYVKKVVNLASSPRGIGLKPPKVSNA